MKCQGREVLLCSCERTMALDPAAIAGALDAQATSHVSRNLCRSETDRFLSALAGGDVMVACTQEAPLFREIAEESGLDGRAQFVNIRERAGWCEDSPAANPKIAALLAEAMVEVAPAGLRSVTSHGVCLVYGSGQAALEAAMALSAHLSVSLVLSDEAGITPPDIAEVAIHRGRIVAASGSLGAFELEVDGYAPLLPSSRGSAQFAMPRDGARSQCDLILDLTGDTPLFAGHDKRDGYLRADPSHPVSVAKALLDLSSMVGEFEKPLYVSYDASICAHGRSGKTGCTNCLDACPAGAIASAGDRVEIDHGICAGCGSCSASCPTGAVSYRYPGRTDLIARINALVSTYLRAGGAAPVLLVHDDRHGMPLIAAMARFGRGLPVNVLPLSVFSVTEVGHEAIAAAVAAGAERVLFLAHPSQAGELPALESQAGLVERVLAALGHESPPHVQVLVETDPDALETALHDLPPLRPRPQLSFSAVGSKRDIARAAFAKLHEAAPERPDRISLPEGAPYGRILVDTDGCTLCLACVGACPTGAILDNPDRPQLRFQESACVQCGVCRETCPEQVIGLEPRYDFTPAVMQQIVLHEEEPAECGRCGKPFGTRKSIERVKDQLRGKNWMFASETSLELIGMCSDCRILAQSELADSPFRAGERPRVRTTDDYLEARALGRELDVDDFLKN